MACFPLKVRFMIIFKIKRIFKWCNHFNMILCLRGFVFSKILKYLLECIGAHPQTLSYFIFVDGTVTIPKIYLLVRNVPWKKYFLARPSILCVSQITFSLTCPYCQLVPSSSWLLDRTISFKQQWSHWICVSSLICSQLHIMDYCPLVDEMYCKLNLMSWILSLIKSWETFVGGYKNPIK